MYRCTAPSITTPGNHRLSYSLTAEELLRQRVGILSDTVTKGTRIKGVRKTL